MENEINQQDSPEISILDEIDSLDKAIIQLKLEIPSITNIELGKRLDVHRDTIAKRLKKVKVQQSIIEYQKNALSILIETQAEAARRLRTIMRTGKEENVVRACREILKGVLSESFLAKVNVHDIKDEADARKLTTDQLRQIIKDIKNESEA